MEMKYEVKSYIDDNENDCGDDELLTARTMADGRRIKENVKTEVNADGTVNEIHEVYQEVVPMALRKRVSRKIAQVPVEETVECLDANGDVVTSKVRSLDVSRLDLNKERPAIDRLADEVETIKSFLRPPSGDDEIRTHVAVPAVEKSSTPPQASKLMQAFEKYAGSNRSAAAAASEVEVEVKTDSSIELILTGIGFVALGLIVAILTYQLV